MIPHLWRKNVSWNTLLIHAAVAVPAKQSKGTKQPLSTEHQQKNTFFFEQVNSLTMNIWKNSESLKLLKTFSLLHDKTIQ